MNNMILVYTLSALVVIFITGRLFLVSACTILLYTLYATQLDTAYLVGFVLCAVGCTLIRSQFTFAL
jgi:hypothetical protein